MTHDLHTHTNLSDGHLSPRELLLYAVEHDVNVLSITDHDTVAAYDAMPDISDLPVRLVPGIEFSTSWQNRGIHIVGLNIDPSNSTLRAGIAKQQLARQTRAVVIADRLTRLGIDNPHEAVTAIAGDATVGRPHFAQHLVAIGKVPDTQTAFRKYLGAGKIGDVKQDWADMAEVIQWINAAGGIPVLAHPTKYRFTMTRLRAFLADFVAVGGRGMEVCCGHQEANVTRRLAATAVDFDLLASSGSDFHHPANKWSRPGGFPDLPETVTPVWDAW